MLEWDLDRKERDVVKVKEKLKKKYKSKREAEKEIQEGEQRNKKTRSNWNRRE